MILEYWTYVLLEYWIYVLLEYWIYVLLDVLGYLNLNHDVNQFYVAAIQAETPLSYIVTSREDRRGLQRIYMATRLKELSVQKKQSK